MVAQPGADLDQPVALQLDHDLAPVPADLRDRVLEALPQPGQDRLERVRRLEVELGGLGHLAASSRTSLERGSPFMIFSWSLMIPSISISGRGGQPGTYMSTGTIWSTPWTIA